MNGEIYRPGSEVVAEQILKIIIGVSGTGKSTIAQKLAVATGGVYLDADDFHSPINIQGEQIPKLFGSIKCSVERMVNVIACPFFYKLKNKT